MFLPPSRSLPMVALVLGCASYAEAFSALPLAAHQGAVRRGSAGMCMSSEPSRRDALVVLGGGLLGAFLGVAVRMIRASRRRHVPDSRPPRHMPTTIGTQQTLVLKEGRDVST